MIQLICPHSNFPFKKYKSNIFNKLIYEYNKFRLTYNIIENRCIVFLSIKIHFTKKNNWTYPNTKIGKWKNHQKSFKVIKEILYTHKICNSFKISLKLCIAIYSVARIFLITHRFFRTSSKNNNLKVINIIYHNHQASHNFLWSPLKNLQHKCTPPRNCYYNPHSARVERKFFGTRYCRTAKKSHYLQPKPQIGITITLFMDSFCLNYANCNLIWTKGAIH